MKCLIDFVKLESPPHKHENYEIIIYTKGKGIFDSIQKNIRISPGKIIIVPPGTMHHSKPDEKDLERICITGDLNRFFNLTSATVVSDNSAGEGLFLAKMIYKNRHSNYEYLTTLINAFMYFLLQALKMKDEIFLAIKDIAEKITDNFDDSNLNLCSLLKQSGYAEDYIRAQFKKVMKKTPTEFLTEIRISHACYLIEVYRKTLSLTDVSEKCGFTDYVYFSRKFKYVIGISPRKYLENIMRPE